MAGVVSRAAVSDAVAARLALVSGATGYYGQIGRTLDGRLDVDPPTKTDGTGRVRPYFIFFPPAGARGDQLDLAGTDPDMTWLCQITAAAGDVADLNALVDRIDATLGRWTPDVPGHRCGPLHPPPGLDLGPVRADQTVQPPRLFLPLQYSTTITA